MSSWYEGPSRRTSRYAGHKEIASLKKTLFKWYGEVDVLYRLYALLKNLQGSEPQRSWTLKNIVTWCIAVGD